MLPEMLEMPELQPDLPISLAKSPKPKGGLKRD